MHPQTYGFMAFFPKDSIAFVHPSTLGILAAGQVTAVTRLSDREILVTLQGAIPAAVKLGDVIENTTWTPQLTIRHCLFTGSNTRGLLVTTRRKVVIEDNEFVKLGMQAILVADDALSWYESGPVRDVLVRHNIFRDCGHNLSQEYSTIAIAPENHELTTVPVHRNIRIDSNGFYSDRPPVLSARSVDGLSFTGNTIFYTHGSSKEGIAGALHVTACSHVTIGDNRVSVLLSGHSVSR